MGINAFMLACTYGSKKVVKILLDENVQIESRSNEGITGFMLACKYNKNIEVFELLLNHGI